MSIKKGNKRVMITLTAENLDKLKYLMFEMNTKQVSKVINELLKKAG